MLEPTKGTKMKVIYNHTEIEVAEDINLSQFIAAQQIVTKGIAVAVNNKVVRRADWDSRRLCAGDDILVITAVCGG